MRISACVATAAVACCFAGTSRAAAPHHTDLTQRAARIAKIFPGWAMRVAPASATKCPVSDIGAQTKRYAPSWYSPVTFLPPLEVDVTLGTWSTSSAAAQAVGGLDAPARISCLVTALEHTYKMRHQKVQLSFTRLTPSWVRPLPSQAKSLTVRIDAGSAGFVNTTVMFVDRHDSRITWAIAFDYNQAPSSTLASRVLRTAER